jgi:alpha-ketoglutarate-dependent taurine dioxygenase
MQVIDKQQLNVRKITPGIGVEVTGIDLAQPVDASTAKQLHDLVIENIAMVIRGQHLTPEQFHVAAKLFGDLMDQDHPKYSFPGMPNIKRHSSFNLATDGKPVKEGIHWHTDGAHRLKPPKFTMLYAVELPDRGGNTNVVNMCAAYQALPEEMRRKLDPMQTANVRLAAKARDRYNANNISIMEAGGQIPTIHPLVRVNDDNGRKGLWFNPSTIDHIVGMDPDTTQDFLDDLQRKTILPQFTYAHVWKVGDFLIWDNRQSMHKVDFDYDRSQHRLHYHAMTGGERPH